MKRIGVSILTLLLFIVTAGSALAEKTVFTPSKVIFEADEIVDKDVLFERAKNGISDLENDKVPREINLTNTDTGEIRKVKQYKTTQLLKIQKDSKGNTIKSFATTVFVNLKKQDLLEYKKSSTNKNGVKIAAGFTDDGYDTTYSVHAIGTIYWNWYYPPAGGKFYDLYRVEGQWEILDSQVTLSNRNVKIVQIGYGTSMNLVNQQTDRYPTNNTFDYNVPSEWEPVMAVTPYEVGEKLTVQINRGGSSWLFSFDVSQSG